MTTNREQVIEQACRKVLPWDAIQHMAKPHSWGGGPGSAGLCGRCRGYLILVQVEFATKANS